MHAELFPRPVKGALGKAVAPCQLGNFAFVHFAFLGKQPLQPVRDIVYRATVPSIFDFGLSEQLARSPVEWLAPQHARNDDAGKLGQRDRFQRVIEPAAIRPDAGFGADDEASLPAIIFSNLRCSENQPRKRTECDRSGYALDGGRARQYLC